MIYVTGDVHGMPRSMSRFNTKKFPKQLQMTKDDYVIVVGDFGWVWDNSDEEKFWLKWLDEKPWTTLFIDGNHENFDLLESYPVEAWNGGKVHKINSSVIHLMRGQVFTLQDKIFFTFGGAASTDKEHRKEHISWWKREMPSYIEYEEGLSNLDKSHWGVDFILTHTCSIDALEWLNFRYGMKCEIDQMHQYFQQIQQRSVYQKWYFGHFHQDTELNNNQRLIYNDLIRVL